MSDYVIEDLGLHVSGSSWIGLSDAITYDSYDSDGNPVLDGGGNQVTIPLDLTGAVIECHFRSSYRSGNVYAKYKTTDAINPITISGNEFTIPEKVITCSDVDVLYMDVKITLAASPFEGLVIYPFAGKLEIIHSVTK